MKKELQALTMQRKLKAERLARHSQSASAEEKSDREKPVVQASRRRRRQAVVRVAVRTA